MIAVCSLAGLALTSVVASVGRLAFAFADDGYTYLTPGSVSGANRAMQVMNACAYAEMLFVPVAALSAAGYMLLVDRAVRRGSGDRGFEVGPLEGRGGSGRGVA